MKREQSFKQKASLSLGMLTFSISSSYLNEQGYASSSSMKIEEDQKQIDWRAYGGNAVYSSR